jgi:hypothetical protein
VIKVPVNRHFLKRYCQIVFENVSPKKENYENKNKNAKNTKTKKKQTSEKNTKTETEM